MSPRRHRLAVRTASVAVAVSIALASLVIFWLVRPYDSVTFTAFATDRAAYAQGDIVTLTNTFCWDGTPFTADRFLVSEVSMISANSVSFPNGYAIPRVAERYADGCSATTIKFDLPTTTPPGEWRIRYVVSYKANPIRVVSVVNDSNLFTVTAKGSR